MVGNRSSNDAKQEETEQICCKYCAQEIPAYLLRLWVLPAPEYAISCTLTLGDFPLTGEPSPVQ
jgi:hypothetical protein